MQLLLERAGPQVDPRKPAKELVGMLPRFRLSKPLAKPKPHFTLDEAKKVVAASLEITLQMVPGYSTPLYFRGLFGLAFVSGYRVGTLMALKWPWFIERADGWWIEGLPQNLGYAQPAKRTLISRTAMRSEYLTERRSPLTRVQVRLDRRE